MRVTVLAAQKSIMLLTTLLLLASHVAVSSTSPFQLIGSDGTCKNHKLVNKFLNGAGITDSAPIDVISIVDCTSDKSNALVNDVYGTSFNADTGVSLHAEDAKAVLYSAFDTMTTSTFCGSKAIDYSCSLPGSLCIAIKGLDIESNLGGFDQIFRRLVKWVHLRVKSGQHDTKPVTVTFLVDTAGCGDDDDGKVDYAAAVENYLRTLLSEINSKAHFPDSINVKVVEVDGADAASIESARETTVSDSSSSSSDGSSTAAAATTVQELAETLATQWAAIPSVIRPVLSPAQREAVYLIESAFATAVAQADVQINQWQARVATGKTVGNFAERVSVLETTAKKEFNKKVAGVTHLAVRERGERLRMLEDHILRAAQRLFRQQLLILEFTVTNDFRRDLAKIISRTDLTEDSERKEQQQQALRRAIFQYKALAAKLEDSALGLVVDEQTLSELTTSLEEIMTEFPETAVAQLEEVRKAERVARSSRGAGAGGAASKRKKKGVARALGVSLSLVGMLRPPGYGNLQGFAGYATSLLGLPMDLLLGVQNDGDSPEIMGDDREYPILRIQPKVNFDIDL